MTRRRIVIFGSNGMLGGALRRRFDDIADVVPMGRAQFDIMTDDVAALPIQHGDYVLNAAGMINRREAPPEAFIRVNSTFPLDLAAQCQRAGARLIHFSTDCVFSGERGLHTESAVPDASDTYGTSKADGEPATALVIRSSIIGPEEQHSYNLLCWALRQRQANGFYNHRWNGITTVCLADAVAQIIEQDLWTVGLRHVHSNDVTKFDVLRMIYQSFGKSVPLLPVAAATPRDTRLRTDHQEFLDALNVPPLEDQISDLPHVADARGNW